MYRERILGLRLWEVYRRVRREKMMKCRRFNYWKKFTSLQLVEVEFLNAIRDVFC